MSVVYKMVPGFRGYRVGDDGSVWTCWKIVKSQRPRRWAPVGRWRRLKPGRGCSAGHEAVTLSRGGKTFCIGVHQLVMRTFVGPCPPGMEVCHEDGDGKNNRLTNLRYDTRKGNSKDRIKHGTMLYGEKNPRAKLTEAAVRAIRQSPDSPNELALRYGVTRRTICLIRERKIWKTLD